MITTLRQRAEVPLAQTWDHASIYPDLAAWEADVAAVEATLAELAAYAGRLDVPTALYELLQRAEQIQVTLGRIDTYAMMGFDVDTTNQAAAAVRERAFSLQSRVMAALAFIEPELLTLEVTAFEAMQAAEPALARYAQYLSDLRRRAPYVRSGEVEVLLARASEPLSTPYSAFILLAESDLRFAQALDRQGQAHPVSTATAETLLQSPDRTLRYNAWASHQDGFLAYKNTLGALYAGSVRADTFNATARGYTGTLAARLFASNLDQQVYDNVIDACNRHLPIWHRYWEIRRRALGLEQLEACDIFAPLVPVPHYSYADAVELVCAAMKPLGEEYVAVARAGLTTERWVDIYPNRGKVSGAYSGGSYATRPFILLNYEHTLVDVSTLAHELGHSMHSWYTRRTQPPIYADYPIFLAEVASNFNQALLRGHLLSQELAPEFELAVLEEALSNFHRYLFLMPILSQFEHWAHMQVEQGAPLTADQLNATLADLFTRAYGPAVRVDPARDGIVWAQFPHLYMAYYVYQYASGIAAANALADGVLHGEARAREHHLALLSAGSSRYPLDVLATAGLDMRTPAPMNRAFAVLEGFVDRLEQLYAGRA